MKNYDPSVLILAEALQKIINIHQEELQLRREQIGKEFRQALQELNSPNLNTDTRQFVYGLKGLAKIIGCSKSTAAKIKASGTLDAAIEQNGNIIRIDAKLAEELYFKKDGNKNTD